MLFSTNSVEFSLTYVAPGCSSKQLQTPTQHVPQHVLWHADAKQPLILVCCVVLHGVDVWWIMTVEPCCIIIEKYRSWLMNPGYVTGVQLRLCIIVLRPSKINSLSNQVMLNLVERVIHLLLPSLLHRAEQQEHSYSLGSDRSFFTGTSSEFSPNQGHAGDKYVASNH